MKKLLITASVIAVAAATSVNAATNRDRIAELEARLAKIESVSSGKSSLSNVQVFGRAYYDKSFQLNSDESGNDNTSELSAARIGAKGDLGNGWSFKIENNFEDESAVANDGLTDVFIKKDLGYGANLQIGQFKEAFGLENLTSSRFITFINRSYTDQFDNGRNLGVQYAIAQKNWSFATGVFGSDAREDAEDERFATTTRFTISPVNEEDYLLHLGVAYNHTNNNDIYSQKKDVWGFEGAVNFGSLSFQSEYTNEQNVGNNGGLNSNDQRIGGDYDSGHDDAFYFQASLFLTGESRSYKGGKFGRIKPESEAGAVEVAYRYTLRDIPNDSEDFQSNVFGINYYANKNIVFKANYEVTDNESTASNDDDEAIILRAQFDF